MVLITKAPPKRSEETFDNKDREEIHRIITGLRHDYLQRHTEALAEFHKAERESNRKLHEVDRLEKHLQRIEEFCKNNNIPLVSTIQEGSKE
jgi:phosphoribosylanthranilate isomerase